MPILLSIEALEADKRYLERQIEAAAAAENPWGTARLMWDNRLAAVNQRIAEVAGSASSYATVALIFDGNPVIGAGDIRLDFTTSALECYQKIGRSRWLRGLGSIYPIEVAYRRVIAPVYTFVM